MSELETEKLMKFLGSTLSYLADTSIIMFL